MVASTPILSFPLQRGRDGTLAGGAGSALIPWKGDSMFQDRAGSASSQFQPFHGGLWLDSHKADVVSRPVAHPPAPAYLILPLQDANGVSAYATVAVGQRVLKGQSLARTDEDPSPWLHAPVSGVVAAIEARPFAHPSGLTVDCIVIANDGLDEWDALPPPIVDYRRADPTALRERMRAAGVAVPGGDPVGRVELLLLNGAECEPYLASDDMLLRERPQDIVGGLAIMQRLLQAETAVIALTNDKPEAYAALTEALAAHVIESMALRRIPARYPTGEPRLLIRALGIESPQQSQPEDSGVVCLDVATAAAVHAATTQGQPFISRYVTVTGQGVARPQVVEAAVGTPVADLIAWCGGYTAPFQRLLLGGPLTGFILPDAAAPIGKETACILAAGVDDLAPPAPVMPCIDCGACADVCPARLPPQQLYRDAASKAFDQAQAEGLSECGECGCCNVVCPSHIPLVQYFRFAKSGLRAKEQARQKADRARQRYQARQSRLEGERRQKEERLRRKEITPTTPATGKPDLKAEIEAAVARARARKAALAAGSATATEKQK